MSRYAAAAERQERRDDVQDGRPAWDKIAPGYDATVTPTHIDRGKEGLRRADLHRGMRFLETS